MSPTKLGPLDWPSDVHPAPTCSLAEAQASARSFLHEGTRDERFGQRLAFERCRLAMVYAREGRLGEAEAWARMALAPDVLGSSGTMATATLLLQAIRVHGAA